MNRLERANTKEACSLATTNQVIVAFAPTYWLALRAQLPLQKLLATSFLILAVQLHTNIMGHMTQTHRIRLFISLFEITFPIPDNGIDVNAKLDHIIICYYYQVVSKYQGCCTKEKKRKKTHSRTNRCCCKTCKPSQIFNCLYEKHKSTNVNAVCWTTCMGINH